MPEATDFSPTVRGAADDVGEDVVGASTLIEAILRRHASDYLQGVPLGDRVWPTDDARQSAQAWLVELRRLIRPGQQIFGRIAIAGLCLLDPLVARTAEDSGLLYAIGAETSPDLVEFLSDEGVRLLRRRAPIVALGLSVLHPDARPPIQSDLGRVQLAIDEHAHLPARRIDRWAVSSGDDVHVGWGDQIVKTLDGFGSTELGWVDGRLVGLPAARGSERGMFVWSPNTEDLSFPSGWPLAQAGSISPEGVCVVAADGALVWSPTVGEPRQLRQVRELVGVATRAGGIGLLTSTELEIADPRDFEFSGFGSGRGFRAVAANKVGVVCGTEAGEVIAQGWSFVDFGGAVNALTEGDVTHLKGGDRLVAAASPHEVAILTANTRTGPGGSQLVVIARWRTPSDNPILAVALSPDDAVFGLATAAGVELWRIDTLKDVQLTSYISDSPDGEEDLLNITPAVNSLGALIAAQAVTPPVSIGLFGAWGSGKSFFMNALERRVRLLAKEAHDSGRDLSSLWAWRNISQVRFNAWNYSSADVWAGMIEQLIAQLARPRDDVLKLPTELEELQKQRLTRLTTAKAIRTQADKDLEDAAATLTHAKEDVAKAEVALADAQSAARNAESDAARQAIHAEAQAALKIALSRAGLAPVVESTTQVWHDLANARRSAESVHGLARSGNRALLWAAALAGPILGVLVALACYVLAPQLASAAGVIALAVGWIGALTPWLRQAAQRIDAQLRAIAEAEQMARAAEQSMSDALAKARTAELQAVTDHLRATEAVNTAASEVAEKEAAVQNATPGSLLQEYLEGRNSSADYRSQLGLIGTVRSDMKVLSDAVTLHNQTSPKDDVVNRVVLYVDDLDRCGPQAVVKVLEAVHLLLSYEIFVVVVAVDAQWVSRSLATVYPTLLGDSTFTPDQYLEKIFQLPVWLDTPSADVASAMARRLLEVGPTSRRSTGSVTSATTAGPVDKRTGPAKDESADRPQPNVATSPPRSVVIEDDERAAIAQLAPLLTRSPRALKRYLNTYRLLKAFISTDELPIARILLAITTGRPAVGEKLLLRVAREADDVTLDHILKNWSDADQAWLASVRIATDWRATTCGAARPIAADVRRFVFRSLSGL